MCHIKAVGKKKSDKIYLDKLFSEQLNLNKREIEKARGGWKKRRRGREKFTVGDSINSSSDIFKATQKKPWWCQT